MVTKGSHNSRLDSTQYSGLTGTDNVGDLTDMPDVNWESSTDGDDVDVTLIHWMLSLSMLERLRVAQDYANSAIRLKNAKKLD